jgi:transposase
LAPPDDPTHDCGWKEYAQFLEKKSAELERRLEALERHRSEKLPPLDREFRRGRSGDRSSEQAKRKLNAEIKTGLSTEREACRVPDDQRQCSKCGNTELGQVGAGKETTIFDYVPGYFRRRVYVRETLSCPCGQYIVTAPGPEKVDEKVRYSAGFMAHLVVTKCGDSTPLYRLEKHYRRIGIPIARSTMTDLFHRAASLLSPLVSRLLALIAASDVVLADETSIKMLGTDKRAYMWTFIADDLIAYKFSPNRSGQTPASILGGTRGALIVDAYTGYNRVTGVDGRTRGGCLAHARRKLFSALDHAPEAQTPLEIIRDVYRVEHDAAEAGLARTGDHLTMRQTRSRPLMEKLRAWLVEHDSLHPPKSQLSRAIRYALNNWNELTLFLGDVSIPPDNNASERALRVVALGRKNYLFVGNEDAGDNIAGLYSLIATCEANGVNPLEYIADVLLRVGSHPADQIDDLLPHRWSAPASTL